MRKRLSASLYGARESLWFLPALLTACAVLLAIAVVRLDEWLAISPTESRLWAFAGGADGARGVLQAIAGSIITVAGTVFSITVVALQLAAGQLSPRVLRTFTRDRGVQLALGVFVATFTYCLLVLRSVRASAGDQTQYVPSASVTGAVLLALISIGFLIFFIGHVSQVIQAAVVIDHVVVDTIGLIDRRFPADVGESRPTPVAPGAGWADAAAAVGASDSGYLRAVDTDELFQLEVDAPLTIRLEYVVGDYVIEGETLASVWPRQSATNEVIDKVRDACMLGPDRTLESDVELGIRQLADVAVKALSPGINDPTTATVCIDRLAQLLVRVAQRGDPAIAHEREGTPVRLVLPAPSFARLVDTAFAQLRHYGAGDAVVMAHLMVVLGRVAKLVPPGCREPVRREAELVLAGARVNVQVAGDRDRVEQAAAWLMETGVPNGTC